MCADGTVCSAVDPKERINCGWAGITPAQCHARSCRFDNSIVDVPWCYYPGKINNFTYYETEMMEKNWLNWKGKWNLTIKLNQNEKNNNFSWIFSTSCLVLPVIEQLTLKLSCSSRCLRREKRVIWGYLFWEGCLPFLKKIHLFRFS